MNQNLKITRNNKKVKLGIDGDMLIISRFLHKQRILLNDIRSAYLEDNVLNILTYDKKIVRKNLYTLSDSDKDIVYAIVDTINKEDVIFGADIQGASPCYPFIAMMPMINIVSKKLYVFIPFCIIYILVAYLNIKYTNDRIRSVTYDINKNEFTYDNSKRGVVEKFNIDDVVLIRKYYKCSYYMVKDRKIKFYLVASIKRPIQYKVAIEELRGIL